NHISFNIVKSPDAIALGVDVFSFGSQNAIATKLIRIRHTCFSPKSVYRFYITTRKIKYKLAYFLAVIKSPFVAKFAILKIFFPYAMFLSLCIRLVGGLRQSAK